MEKKNQVSKKQRKGKVVKVVDERTAKVVVERKAPHPLYKKIVKSHKKYLVETGGRELNVGDEVTIEETNPVSKNKMFKIVK